MYLIPVKAHTLQIMLSCTEYRTYEGAKSGLEVAKGRNQKSLWIVLLEIVTARLETKSGQKNNFSTACRLWTDRPKRERQSGITNTIV